MGPVYAMLPAMSWESVDALPAAASAGSPYQGASQPIVARRTPLSAWERARLIWRSTPELPSARAAREVVLTPNHLYVRRVDGTHQRVALEALSGRRYTGPMVVYGVVDGEDLALLLRRDCAVTAALDERFKASEKVGLAPIVFEEGHAVALALAIVAALLATYLLTEYRIESMWDRLHRGLYTAEVVLGVVGGFTAALAALLFLLFLPMHWRIDTLGVHRARGFLPWLHYHDPPDSFRAAVVSVIRTTQSGRTRYRVLLTRRSQDARDLWVRSFVDTPEKVGGEALGEATALAERAAALLGVPVERRG